MAKTITTRYDGTCRDCGAFLPAGTRARWYGRGRVYGLSCHDRDGTRHWPTAQELAENDGLVEQEVQEAPHGGPCEDFPCCGHHDGDGRNPFCGAARRAEFNAARRAEARERQQARRHAGAIREAVEDVRPQPTQVEEVDRINADLQGTDLVALARGLG
jgi:hypothetical protein